jgi:hypothetical protein
VALYRHLYGNCKESIRKITPEIRRAALYLQSDARRRSRHSQHQNRFLSPSQPASSAHGITQSKKRVFQSAFAVGGAEAAPGECGGAEGQKIEARYVFRISSRTSLLAEGYGMTMSNSGRGPCPGCGNATSLLWFQKHLHTCRNAKALNQKSIEAANSVADSCKRDQ